MDKKQAQQRIGIIRKELNKWAVEYFDNNSTLFDEQIRDQLKKELISLENQFPELITKDSPSQKIGGDISTTKFEKVAHLTPKMSLADYFTFEEVSGFLDKINKHSNEFEPLFVEPKLDGLNITLWYKNGRLIKALTRGNGKVGEDVTHNILTIKNLPKILEQNIDLELSGEVFISKSDFEIINNNSETIYANPRNLASGSVRQIDPQKTAERNLQINIYSIGQNNLPKPPKDQFELFKLLDSLKIPHNKEFRLIDSKSKLFEYLEYLTENRDSFLMQLDGVVIKVNNFELFEKIGYTAKTPKAAAAYKFPAEKVLTKILDITIQVGRLGTLTPVAELEPVVVAGSTVSRATLHNFNELQKKDVRINDTVVIHKAGDIIPEVVSVLKELRTGKEIAFTMPENCPVCNFDTETKPDQKQTRCLNPNCPAKSLGALKLFVGKTGFNIDGLGEQNLVTLLDYNVIQNAADLFSLTREKMQGLPLFKDKKINNILESIQNARQITLSAFLNALSIPLLGQQMAYALSEFLVLKMQNSPSISTKLEANSELLLKDLLDLLFNINATEVIEIEGFGPNIADSIESYFHSVYNQSFLKDLASKGIAITIPQTTSNSQKLNNQKFLFTGSLELFTRNQAKQMVLENGGQIASSVSKNLDFLVAGAKAGSKLKKAEELEIPVISEEEFLKLIQ